MGLVLQVALPPLGDTQIQQFITVACKLQFYVQQMMLV